MRSAPGSVPALLLVALALAGCEGGGETGTAAAPGQAPPAAADTAAAPAREPAIAKVGERAIPEQQFEDFLAFKRLATDDPKRRERLLEDYLEREALASVIEGEGVLDKARVEAELNEFRKEMLISRYFEKFLADTVTDEAVLNYYNTHSADYEERKVKVAHILIRTDRSMGEAERQAKLTTARAAHAKVLAGEDFAEVAKAFSEDTLSGKRGGNLGWLKEGAIDARFSQVAFGLEPGEVSEPFESPFGFHVVKVLEGPVVVKRPFDAVKGDIRYMLRNRAKDAELERLLSKVRVERTGGGTQ